MSDGPIEFDLDELEKMEVTAEPPKEEKSSRKGSGSGSSSGTSARGLRKRLENQIKMIGTVLSGFDRYDGSVIKEAAPDLAEQLDQLAKESPKVKQFLEAGLSAGAWGGVIGVVGVQVVGPIAVHHRLLPEPINSELAEQFSVPVVERKRPGEEAAEDVEQELRDQSSGAGSVG